MSAQSIYGPPVAYCPPSCKAPSNLTLTQNVTDCTATTTLWGRHTNTVTTTTTTTGPPTACPFRLTVTPFSSACPTTTAQNFTTTLTHNITSTVAKNVTSTVTQNVTSTLTHDITISATPTSGAATYTGPFIEILAFASSNCSNAGAEAIGYPTDIDRYILTIDPTTNSSPCNKFTGPVGSIEYNVIGTAYAVPCYMNFYDSDQCVSDSISQVNVNAEGDQCWEFARPLGVQVFCSA